ncbi:unnamed protein product [Phytophthora fragariaefolia]|uniref:Unnamed protein product n=1 Tax=Phytophthora fragariaefolia TaxID=1490495 RepID=A0A9W6Y7Z6_9STRA|nr:unnamed protein product [Phytophthora fragariaefolia]
MANLGWFRAWGVVSKYESEVEDRDTTARHFQTAELSGQRFPGFYTGVSLVVGGGAMTEGFAPRSAPTVAMSRKWVMPPTELHSATTFATEGHSAGGDFGDGGPYPFVALCSIEV